MSARAHHAVRLVDAGEKVFPDTAPRPLPRRPLLVTPGATASFQVAWLPPTTRELGDLPRLRVRVDAGPGAAVRLSSVDLVPVLLATFEDPDEHHVRTGPGLYPDPLRPLGPDEALTSWLGAWRAVWVDVAVSADAPRGPREVRVELVTADGGGLVHAELLVLDVLPHVLPPLDIAVTHWLHTDCLADRYGVEPFGERHWELLEEYLPSLVRLGGNTVLTPLFTPPLDTAVGARRTSTQLLRAEFAQGRWTFDFTDLDRWAALCVRHGIRTLEMPHLFTQWGARATPSITARTADGPTEVFGWHVGATDPRYREFLAALLPQLRAHLARRWPGLGTVWHLSDEPGSDALAGYLAARAVVGDLLRGELVVDALSDREFLTSGSVDLPVVATDAAAPFVAAGDEFWAYYCNGQDRGVSNRFLAQPGWVTRAVGQQLFATGAAGFLHWGFNFWSAQLSTRAVDPWTDPSAGGAFPAGDAFVVYPGADGRPVESVRHRLLAQAMDDHRALQLLRESAGADVARAALDGDDGFRFADPGVPAARRGAALRDALVRLPPTQAG